MNEKIDLYDADRCLTGQTAYRGEKLPEGTYRMVIHVCIFNEDNEMLIQHRHPDVVRWPDYWDVSVGGGAVAGDDSRVAAARETKEELGLDVDLSGIRPLLTANFSEGFDDFYVIDMDVDITDLKLQADEVSEVHWAGIDEIEQMIEEGKFIPYEDGFLRYIFNRRTGWNL